jgi:hypothetical protein
MPKSLRKSRSRSISKSQNKKVNAAKVSTKLMVEFMTLYNNRCDGILSSDEILSKSDIARLSDVEYLKGIAESVKHGFSILELKGLLHINDHSNSKTMKGFLDSVRFVYGYKIDIDDFLKYLKLMLTRRAEPGRIELLDGGNGKKMLEFLFRIARLYGLYLMVTYMSRSLQHRTEVSKTANAIVELMTTSSCPVPDLSPAFTYLIDNNWISESEERILIAAKMTDMALSGGCNPLQAQIEDILFSHSDGSDKHRTQEMMSELVPVSSELTVGPGDYLTTAVSREVDSISKQYDLASSLPIYEIMANSLTRNDFERQLEKLKPPPPAASQETVILKKSTTMLDVVNYAYGGIKGQVTEYWKDVTQFQMLNPTPVDDAFREMKHAAKVKIMNYKHLVDKGMLTMETAHDELWAWIKHASILFILTKAGVCAGVSLLIWIAKEMNGWRRGNSERRELDSEYSGRYTPRIKSRGGTKTKKLRKMV